MEPYTHVHSGGSNLFQWIIIKAEKKLRSWEGYGMGVREELGSGISNISTIGIRNDLCTSLRNTTTV